MISNQLISALKSYQSFQEAVAPARGHLRDSNNGLPLVVQGRE